MAGLIAAIMSHLSGAVNSCSTIATVDLYLPYVNKHATERQAVRFGRITGIVIFTVSMMCADPDAWQAGHARVPLPAERLRHVHARHRHHVSAGNPLEARHAPGALAAGLLTIPLTLVLQFWLLPDMPFFNRTGIVFWVCMAVGVAVSLLTEPKPEAELTGLIWNADSLRLPAEQRGLYARAAAAVSLVGRRDGRGAVLLLAISLTDGGWR